MPAEITELPLGCGHEVLGLYGSEIAQQDLADALDVRLVKHGHPRADLILDLRKRLGIFALTDTIDMVCAL